MANLGRGDQQLTQIATIQKFDGSFNLDAQLANVIGINISTLNSECQGKAWDARGWATAVVLAFFVCKLEKLAGDWELMADKSKLWLSTTYKDKDEIPEAMFERALKLF